MLEKFKMSLWDLFTFFVTGALIMIILKFYQITIPFEFDFANSELIKGVFYGILIYTIGIIFEPISNFCFRKLIKIYEWRPLFKTLVTLSKEQQEVYFPKVKQIIIDKYGLTDIRTDYYQIAKAYLAQKNIENSYMIFLSRFGFYRNLSVLLFINLLVFPFVKGNEYSFSTIVIILLVIFIFHISLYKRGRQFYLYTGNEIYRNFILHHH